MQILLVRPRRTYYTFLPLGQVAFLIVYFLEFLFEWAQTSTNNSSRLELKKKNLSYSVYQFYGINWSFVSKI